MPVNGDGQVSIEAVQAALDGGAELLCLMAANNEVGAIQPVQAAAERTSASGAAILVNATQAAGRIPSLDGPLVDLGLLLPSGERRGDAGRIETVYAFRREPKPEITPALFDYCLMDFWSRFHHDDQTLSLRAATLAPYSPGQVFKLTEDDVRARLEETGERAYAVPYSYKPSAVQGLLTRRVDAPALTLTVYGRNRRS